MMLAEPRRRRTFSFHSAYTPVGSTPRPPFFPVATHKFIVMSICTFGMYELYWFYQNWKRLREASQEDLSPFWRTFFAPLWSFSLFERVRDIANAARVPVGWSAGALAAIYLILSITWRLPDPWWLISLATLVPLVPVQRAAQRVNEQHGGMTEEDRNHRYSTLNLMTIVAGVSLLLTVILEMAFPEISE